MEYKEDLNISILYCEDDNDIRETIYRIIKRRFKNIYLAKDGVEGLESYKQNSPDIILTDILMPKMNGLEMSNIIKEINPDAYIVVTTAHSDSEHLLEAINIGINSYLIKPIDKQKLLSILEKGEKLVSLEKKLQNTQTMFASLSENSLSGIFVYDRGYLYTNKEYHNITGYTQEELETQSFVDIFQDEYKAYAKLMVESKELGQKHHEATIISKDGQTKWIHVAISLVNIDNKQLCMGNVIDISKQKDLQKELEKKASTDSLTGAINKGAFSEILSEEIERYNRYGRIFSVIMFDLDHFKVLNDTYGHLVGDEVLIAVSEIVEKIIRKTDFFIRWGGEEFIVLAPETGTEHSFSIAEKIREAVETYKFKNLNKNVTISLGIATVKNGDDSTTIIKRADDALYNAKNSGRNCTKN